MGRFFGLFVLLAIASNSVFATAPAQPSNAPILNFTIRGVDDNMDLHGDPTDAELVIFAAGNQWMVMPDLIAAFQTLHPEVRRVFYETLPPGVLANQMVPGTSIRVGELVLDVRADVYLAGARRMAREKTLGFVRNGEPYATNVLAIMVRAGNPKRVENLKDLGRNDVRVAMPNPQTEGVARQIEAAYRAAGGSALDETIMETKLRDGTTMLTRIHHRETPIWILEGKADAGPVWLSEALYQERIHSGLETIRIPAKDNHLATYEAAVTTYAPHAASANAFVEFLTSDTAQAIYRSYGFGLAKTKE